MAKHSTRAARKPSPASGRDPAILSASLSLIDGAGFLVRVVGSRATSAYEQRTGQSDITPQQFGVLLTLHQRGTMTLTALADAVFLDRSTLGEMVRRMASRGLLDRSGNDADRRSTVVAIAPAGESALLRLVEGAAAVQDVLLEPLSPQDRRIFLRCLKRIAMASSENPSRREPS